MSDENAREQGKGDNDEKRTLRNGNERHVAPEGNDYAKGNKGGPGAPEGNTLALKHGVTADPTHLLDELEPDEQEFVEQLAGSFLEIAPFDHDSPLVERLQITCIKAVQERRGEREIVRDGPTVEKVVSVSEDGEEHTERDEHHLARFTSRLSKDIRLSLKDLGCLPDPDTQQAEATESLAQVLAGGDDQ